MKNTFAFAPSGDREIVISRDFDAPRELVFEAFTSPEWMMLWLLGPDGWELPVCEVDLRPGGRQRLEWRHAKGRTMGMTAIFREVDPPARLVHTELFDEDWTGGETVVTTTFTEAAGRTTVQMTVLYVSEAARDMVMKSGMDRGMKLGYERLDDLLKNPPIRTIQIPKPPADQR